MIAVYRCIGQIEWRGLVPCGCALCDCVSCQAPEDSAGQAQEGRAAAAHRPADVRQRLLSGDGDR